MKNYHDIVLALAGVCQSAKLVHQLATESRADSDTFLTALNSLFITQPQRIEDVFGGEVRHLKLGLETLIHQLNAQGDQNLTRYWLSLLALEGKLSKNPDAKQTLGNRIFRLKEQEIHYARDSETMLSIMANIYSDVISPLGKKNSHPRLA
ncbi:lysogenization regulator [Haemophilus influenzae]|uniref:Lysogenization regulator n=1 Tax=Haemophilus influenzae TaxID=727 RepID=A0A2X1RHD7_HAEIF|nr:lysogenization regulator [Haemophilus influenzae]